MLSDADLEVVVVLFVDGFEGSVVKLSVLVVFDSVPLSLSDSLSSDDGLLETEDSFDSVVPVDSLAVLLFVFGGVLWDLRTVVSLFLFELVLFGVPFG